MAVLLDQLKQFLASIKGSHPNSDSGIELPLSYLKNGPQAEHDSMNITPKDFQNNKATPDSITGDDGNYSADQKNPFLDAMKGVTDAYKKGGGSLIGFVNQLLNPTPNADISGQITPGTGTVGGQDPSVTPGQGQDAALNPTDTADQPQKKFQRQPIDPNNSDLDNPNSPANNSNQGSGGNPYEQPTALDPTGIEQLRQSLLTQAGQLDPSNPNGLAGRMSDPNSKVDMQNQMGEAQAQTDSIRSKVNSTKADRRNQRTFQ